jgi:hypothetical protein
MSETETKDPDMTDDELVERLYDIARMRAADGTWFGANGGTPEHTTEWLAAERITRLRSLSTTVDVEGEREACARIAEDDDGHITHYGEDRNTRVSQETGRAIAAAIRSRGPSREGEKDLVQTAVQGNGSVIDPAWQLVPKEPTQEMMEAGVVTAMNVNSTTIGLPWTSLISLMMRAGFKSMLSASPTPPEPLTADFTKTLPGHVPDDASYEQIESALDRIDAPSVGEYGQWLKLHERIAALSPPAPREVTRLKEALQEILTANIADSGDPDEFPTDDGPVALYGDGTGSNLTFALIRKARAALSSGGENNGK